MVNLYQVYVNLCDILGSSLEAKELIAYALDMNRVSIYEWKEIQISMEQRKRIEKFVEQRKNGKPLAYILSEWEFYSLTMKVSDKVLIPRPDTETLVDAALEIVQPQDKILDICTGSGCVAIALAKNTQNTKISAIDISMDALEIAKQNAKYHQTEITFLCKDILTENITEKFDIIVSNPPYIPTQDILTLDKDVKDFEPKIALDGGVDGLIFYRTIAKNLKKNLNPQGYILFEYGIGQEQDIVQILQENGYQNIEIKKDLCGIYRVVKATV